MKIFLNGHNSLFMNILDDHKVYYYVYSIPLLLFLACPDPYVVVVDVGCLYVVKTSLSNTFTQDGAKTKCNKNQNGFLFEFKDFASQHQAVAELLFVTTGAGDWNSPNIDLQINQNYSINLFSAEIGTDYISVWIGLRKNSDGSYHYERTQLEEPNSSSAWRAGEPYGRDCVYMWLVQYNSIVNTQDDHHCTESYNLAICEIPS